MQVLYSLQLQLLLVIVSVIPLVGRSHALTPLEG